MGNKLKLIALTLAILVISVTATVSVLMERYHRAVDHDRVTIRCDTVVVVDSVFIEKPVVRDRIVTRYVTRCLPVAGKPTDDTAGMVAMKPAADAAGTVAEHGWAEHGWAEHGWADRGSEVAFVPKSAENANETVIREIVAHSNGGIGLSQDSVNVILPIEQRTYSSDQYTAWVSGYDARLDSIALYTKEVVVEKTIYLDKKRRRWGCVVGAGVGTNLKGVSPYVGITVGYSLFR